MAKGKKWILAAHFDGLPKQSDLEVQEFSIPDVKDGDVLVETLFLSVDPYMRGWASKSKPGDTMPGGGVARVTQSKAPNFKVGDTVLHNAGWVTHAVQPAQAIFAIPPFPEEVPLSLALGTVGFTGMTAYFGLQLCELKPTDTVYVNAAAGAVGSVVGQIAKIKGCRVIGSAGSEEKLKYLKDELGFDEVYNYKTVTPDKLKEELNKLAPEGIDVFYENVGGEASSVVYTHINKHGRVAVCGTISNYNSPAGSTPKVTEFTQNLIYNSVTIRGFTVMDFFHKRDEALKELGGWVKEGKIKYREQVYEGFDSMYSAFMDLFSGKNKGKVIIKL